MKPVTVEQALEGRANQEKMTSDTIASLKQIAADSFNEGCGGSLGIGIVCKLSMGFGATNPITETKATTGERIGWFAQALLNIVGLKAAVGSVAGENVIKDGAGGSLKPSISYDPPGSVVLQGDAPVCGSACAAMTITGNTGRSLSLVDAIGGFANGIRSSGVNTLELSEVLSNAGVYNTVKATMLPSELNQVLQGGRNVILQVPAGGNGYRFIIVDSVKVVDGVGYYMTRDPLAGPRGVMQLFVDRAISSGANTIIVGR
ncbi:hypothetical protein [Pseudomonas marginalis]|uniref:hypothetical protein n=1 Tax=Pseudomonas marginalis TaxID=298 RepID=UPI0034D65C8D